MSNNKSRVVLYEDVILLVRKYRYTEDIVLLDVATTSSDCTHAHEIYEPKEEMRLFRRTFSLYYIQSDGFATE